MSRVVWGIVISVVLLVGGHGVWSHEAKAPYQEAVRAYSQHRDAEALSAVKRALSIYPNYAEAHYNAAMCYEFYLHDPSKALAHYRQYVALGGNDVRVQQLLQATKQE